MVFRLHVWGPAFGLPSIDPECIATVAYFRRIVPHGEWTLVADYDTSISPESMRDNCAPLLHVSDMNTDEFPLLLDGSVKTTGFLNIVSYLRNHHSGAYDLDYSLTHQQQTERTAYGHYLLQLITFNIY
jgi:hypothetical protein